MGKKAPLLADLLQEVIGGKITYGNTSGRCMAVQKLSEFCDETEHKGKYSNTYYIRNHLKLKLLQNKNMHCLDR